MRNHMRTMALMLLACLVGMTSCIQPTSAETDTRGSLVIKLPGFFGKALLPNQSLTIASYDISGTGPGGASFSLPNLPAGTTSTGRQYLAVGAWTITVTGKNNQGTVIAAGSASTTIEAKAQQTVNITLTSPTGNGAVSLNATWPVGIVASPSLAAFLTPTGGGADVPLAVTPGGDGRSASLANPGVPAGLYTLNVVLKDGLTEVGKGVDAVQVAQDMSTTGTLSFQYDPSIGAMAVNIQVGLTTPVTVNLSTTATTLDQGTTCSIQAASSETITAYRWYVNGTLEPAATEATYLFGAGRGLGTYRVDLLAFSGTRVGSASTFIQIILPRVAPVTFTPPAGPVTTGTSVMLATATAGATIFYTLDGTTPTTDSLVYNSSSPPVLTMGATIKAFASASGYSNSLVATGAYTMGAADVIHVSTTGNDSNPGTQAEPMRTVAAAVAYAQANDVPEVHVAAGTYPVTLKYGIPITKTIAIRGGYNPANWSNRAYLTEANRADATYSTTLVYNYPFNGISEWDCPSIFSIYDATTSDGVAVEPIIEGFTLQTRSASSTVWTTLARIWDQAFPIFRNNTFYGAVLAGNAYLIQILSASAEIADSVFTGFSPADQTSFDIAYGNPNSPGWKLIIKNSNFNRSVPNSWSAEYRSIRAINQEPSTELQIIGNSFTPSNNSDIQAQYVAMELYGYGSVSKNTLNYNVVRNGNDGYIRVLRCGGLPLSISNNRILKTQSGRSQFPPILINGWGNGDKSQVEIVNNQISGPFRMAGIGVEEMVRAVTGNLIASSEVEAGGGVVGAAAYISNNTIILSNTWGVPITAIHSTDTSSRISNNLISISSTGTNIGFNDNGGNPLEFRNNLFYMDPGEGGAYYYDNQGGYKAINDILWVNEWDATTNDASRPASGNIAYSPSDSGVTIFVNAASGDYRLSPSAPTDVRNGGLDLSGLGFWPRNGSNQVIDLDGTARTTPWSIGAYERN